VQQNYQQAQQQIPGGPGVTPIQNQQIAPGVAFAAASNQSANGGGGPMIGSGGSNPTAAHPQQQLQQQSQQQQQTQQQLQEQTTTEVVQEKFKGFLKQAKDNLPTPNKKPAGPNLGFKPTAAMAQQHEDALVSGKRPLYQFQVRAFNLVVV